jgi:hypothetical protein
MRVSDIEYEELERWKVDWAHLLSKSPPIPLHDTDPNLPPDGEENSTIELNLWFCQILLHRTAMKFQFDTERLSLEVIQLSRLIVSKVLQARLSTALGFIDHVYVILGYAALNLCDANTLDPLIEDIQMYLLRLSPNERHITYRYSCMIADFKQRCAESQLAFGDAQARKADAEQMQLVHPLVNAMGDGCPPWSQIIPDFVAQSYPDGMFDSIAVADESPAVYRSATM